MKDNRETLNLSGMEMWFRNTEALPAGWVLRPLRIISIYIKRGKSPCYCEFSELPVINQKAVRWDRIDESVLKFIDPKQFKDFDETRYIKPDDILWNSTGTGTVGRAYCVKEIDCLIPKVVDSHVTIVRSKIKSKYLYYWIKSSEVQHRIQEMCDGSTNQIELTRSTIEGMPIPLPPLPEQERIAARLDLLLGRLKAARKRLDAVPELLKRFRKSVLAMAVSGRLTEEWRAEHAAELPSAEELLAQVRKERREAWEKAELEKMRAKGKVPRDDGWKRKLKEEQARPTDYVDQLPAEWIVTSFGLSFENLDFARVPVSQEERKKRIGLIPYYGAVGQIDTISGYTHEGAFLLIGEDGANLLSNIKPNAFLAKGQIWVNNHAHVLMGLPSILNSYGAIVINSLDLSPWVSGSAQPKLTQENLSKILLPLPSPSEQHEIVRQVDELFAYADALEARVAVARKMAERLEPSILVKAFRGELSEQIPEEAAAWEKTLAEFEAATGALGEKVAKRGRKPREHAAEGGEAAERATLAVETPRRKPGRPPKIEVQADAPKRPRGRPRKV